VLPSRVELIFDYICFLFPASVGAVNREHPL